MGVIREMMAAHGKAKVVQVFQDALRAKKLDPWRVSMRELWEETVGPCGDTLTYAARANALGLLQEAAVDSSAFKVMMGSLIASTVIAAYDAEPAIGDQLVSTVPSKQRGEKFPGFNSFDGLKTVEEGHDYEDSSWGEKYVTTQESKKGRILTLTEETIFFDQTGQLLNRARGFGENAKREKEKVILNTVQDITSYRAYYPSGTVATLYATGYHSLKASNALVDWTDIDAALSEMWQATDESGERINVVPKVLLVPRTLAATAHYIVNGTTISTQTSEQVDQSRQTVAPNRSDIRGLAPLSSYYLDAQSTSTWYIGDPKRQFIWREIWPIQVLMARLEEDAFRRDVVAAFKVRMYGGCNAVDHRFFVKNTA